MNELGIGYRINDYLDIFRKANKRIKKEDELSTK